MQEKDKYGADLFEHIHNRAIHDYYALTKAVFTQTCIPYQLLKTPIDKIFGQPTLHLQTFTSIQVCKPLQVYKIGKYLQALLLEQMAINMAGESEIAFVVEFSILPIFPEYTSAGLK